MCIGCTDCDFLIAALKEPTCTSSQKRCTNKWCVSKSATCDFTDDCGDMSDEAGCDSKLVHHYCHYAMGDRLCLRNCSSLL